MKSLFREAFDRETLVAGIRIVSFTVAFFGTVALIGAVVNGRQAA